MALEKQLVQVPPSAGLDTKSDSRWLDPGHSTSLINCAFTKKGSIRKRPGYTALSKTILNPNAAIATPLAVGSKLLAYKNQLCLVSGSSILTYSPGAGAWIWQDHAPDCVATRTTVSQSVQTLSFPDVDEGSGFRVYVALGSDGNVYATVIDTATGATPFVSYPLTTGGTFLVPRVVITGGFAIVLYTDNANHILARTLNLSSPSAWTAQTTLRSDYFGVFGAFAATPIVGTSNFAIFFERALTPTGALYSYNTSLAQQAANFVTNESNSGMGALALRGNSGSGENLWIAYSVNAGGGVTNCRVACANPSTLAQVAVPFTVFSASTSTETFLGCGIERFSKGEAVVLFTGQYETAASGLASVNAQISYALVSTSSVVASSRQQQCAAISRPFVNGTTQRFYCFGLSYQFNNPSSPDTQPTELLLDLMISELAGAPQQARPVAYLAPRFAYQFNFAQSLFPVSGVTNIGSTTATAFRTAGTVEINNNAGGKNGVTELTANFAHQALGLSAEMGEGLYYSAGCPSVFDGTNMVESGFSYYIDQAQVTRTTATTGGGLANQKYTYVFLFEWMNDRGERFQSNPSAAKVIDLTGSGTQTNTVTFTVPAQCLTSKQEPQSPAGSTSIAVVVYRTSWSATASAFLDGGALFRVTPDNIPTANLNNVGAASISFTDTGIGSNSDATIAGNAPLVFGASGAGVLGPECPSSFLAMCVHKNRIWGVADDGKTIYFSTPYSPGQPVYFNDALSFPVEEGSGPLTALFAMDDALYCATAKSVWMFTGDGPNNLGQGSQLEGPYHVTSDQGVIDPRSIVLTPQGTMFQSSTGIYLLSRSREVSYAGAAVEDLLALTPLVVAATLVPARNEVRFACNDPTGVSTGQLLVYNYLFGAWSSWSLFDTDQNVAASPIASACLLGDTYCWVTPKGQVYQESPTNFTDNGHFVSMSIQTAAIKPSGIAGFGRFWRALATMQSLSPADITIGAAQDYGPSTQAETWTASTIAGFTTPMVEIDMRIANQKTPALTLSISDATPTGEPVGSGAGFNFISFQIEMGVYPGARRLPSGQEG